ncbi:hypothetical protein [Halobellus sp. H-GB7]|uniref:hypothetical protein n=1 Tax=Halobellus sp. H-GB7 TaxID=3069756 RepID=UPI0027B1A358|nr:hypothetical protein [Halobellus sp. H-GB7]MDQ2053198.1 hypothetical protein [Halobellus sp. H-GB7]
MTSITHLLFAGDGYGGHIESGLRYISLCGTTFDPEAVDREAYACPNDPDHKHAHLCFDCTSVRNGGSVREHHRSRHGGASA